MNKKIYPPTYFYCAIIIMVLLHYFLPLAEVVEPPRNYTGVIFILLGLIILFWASYYFGKVNTTFKPFEESEVFVKTGLYRYSRNPMYFGMALVLTGVFVLCGTLSSLLIIPIFVFLITKIFITKEEKMMIDKFGKDYKNYMQDVRRWI